MGLLFLLWFVRISRMKAPNPPGSGKGMAKGKGVRREAEFEGNRMAGKDAARRETFGLVGKIS